MSLPSVLPADGVTVLWVLWEGDVDSDQGRAVLHGDATSNHGYPAGEKDSKPRHKEKGEFTMMENIMTV